MTNQSVAQRILIDGDHKALRRHWGDLFPHLAAQGPKTLEDAEVALHMARTQVGNIPIRLRAWSHRWLRERGHISFLPDDLKPKAEQICPIVKEAVLISNSLGRLGNQSPLSKAIAPLIRREMENAVLDAEAEGRLGDAPFVKARMQEARGRAVKELLGSTLEKLMKGH
jgi:hypothetical protein